MPLKPREVNPRLTPAALRAWRVQHAWSQHDLAQKLHVNQATWSRWEDGTRAAPWYLALALNWLEAQDHLPPRVHA